MWEYTHSWRGRLTSLGENDGVGARLAYLPLVTTCDTKLVFFVVSNSEHISMRFCSFSIELPYSGFDSRMVKILYPKIIANA